MEQLILVVDDITDTGESLELAVRQVADQAPARVESATFLHIQHSKYRPTYTAEEIPRDAWVWIVFPWNYWEDVVQLAGRAEQQFGPGIEKIRTTLAEQCGLHGPVEDLERIAARAPAR